ncbi:conserved protein of unknown function [Tenacibaculum sp. 190524A02b]|uniref:hypothetical protein n=1 Tax=Tenacibaculum vairaonense TaxID=3137860 RepID=UPI0032B2D165
MKIKLITYFMFIPLFFSCNKNELKLNNSEANLMEDAIDYIRNKNHLGMKDCYIVSPYFNYYNLSDFFDSKDKSFVNYFESKNKNKLIEKQKNINDKYWKKKSRQLGSFSKCDSSKYVIRFSGLDDSIIIAYLEEFEDKKNLSSLKPKEKLINRETIFYFFVLDKNKKIVKVLEDAVSW